MARLKLKLPESYLFQTKIDVRVTDINYGGHLGNDALLSIIHEARVRFLQHLGFTEMNAGGPGIILSDIAVVYKAEIFYPETLTIKVGVEDFAAMGCDFVYGIFFANGEEAARAKTGVVFYDYQSRKARYVPDAFRNKVDETNKLSTT